jgi:hypothetical protein
MLKRQAFVTVIPLTRDFDELKTIRSLKLVTVPPSILKPNYIARHEDTADVLRQVTVRTRQGVTSQVEHDVTGGTIETVGEGFGAIQVGC